MNFLTTTTCFINRPLFCQLMACAHFTDFYYLQFVLREKMRRASYTRPGMFGTHHSDAPLCILDLLLFRLIYSPTSLELITINYSGAKKGYIT